MTKKNHLLFSPAMKMADILLENYTLLSLLPRFGIHLGFGDKSLAEVCVKYNMDIDFFLLVCNTYTFEAYQPAAHELKGLHVDDLTAYLSSSHHYYVHNRIAAIEADLEGMRTSCSENHYKIIKKFFSEYKQEIINHFRYEEEIVFPYIQQLAHGEIESNFHIDQYEDNHSNIDEKLSDLKNILIKYLPETDAAESRNQMLFDICLFEADLIKHTNIEEKILIPFVKEIERQL